MSQGPPPEIVALLEERAAARDERDWPRADALRDRVRELGWEAVDTPEGSTARPMLAGASAAGYADDADLGSILDQPPEVACTLVAVVDDYPGDLARLVAALERHPQGAEHELLVVANAPADAVPDLVDSVTVLNLGERVGWADAVNLGMRRSRGGVVILLDTSVEPTGDILGPLLAAFDNERVGIAGPWGVTSADGRQFEEAPVGEVDAIEGYCLAVRRAALRQVGGFDHRFRFYRNADLDLSFAVRAHGWKAMRTPPLPVIRHEHRGWAAYDEAERDRLSRRNFYRFLKNWGDRRDLLLHPGPRPGPDRQASAE